MPAPAHVQDEVKTILKNLEDAGIPVRFVGTSVSDITFFLANIKDLNRVTLPAAIDNYTVKVMYMAPLNF